MSAISRVSREAGEAYAAARKLSVVAATDELLRVLADAKESATEPGRWRYRNRSDGIDVTARVVNGCVVSVTCRSYAPPKGGRKR